MVSLKIKDVDFYGDKGSIVLEDNSSQLYEFSIAKDKACILSLVFLGVYAPENSFYKLLDNLFTRVNLSVNAVIIADTRTEDSLAQVEIVGKSFCERYWLNFPDALIMSVLYNAPIYSKKELKGVYIERNWMHFAEEMLHIL